MNIFQKAITPDMPRVLEGEQIYVYVPQATSTNAGIASYKNADFKVNDSVVSLRWPIQSIVQGPLATPCLIKVQDTEFEYSNANTELEYEGSTISSTISEIQIKRDLRDAYNRPDLVMLDPNYFVRTIVEKDGKQYYKYNTTAVHYNMSQKLSDNEQAQARLNIGAGSLAVVEQSNRNSSEALSKAAFAEQTSIETLEIVKTSDASAKEAVVTANKALTNSGQAITTADTALTNSNKAIAISNTALNTSNNAISTANSAKIESASAKSAADTAAANSTTALITSQEAKNIAGTAEQIAQNALDLITETVGTQVLVNGEAVLTFNADTKADVAYVNQKIDEIMGPGSTEAIDTILELADAFKNNSDVIKVLNESISTKANASDVTNMLATKANTSDLDNYVTKTGYTMRASTTVGEFYYNTGAGEKSISIKMPTIPVTSVNGLTGDVVIDTSKYVTSDALSAVTDATLSSDSKTLTITKRDGTSFNFQGGGGGVPKATCSTSSGTDTKVVDLDGFVVEKGATIDVTFTYSNGSGLPKLNVNSTGAKSIQYYTIGANRNTTLLTRAGGGDTSIPFGGWRAGDTVRFFYDGTYWIEVMNISAGAQYAIPYRASSADSADSASTSTTRATTDNSTNIATTAFVKSVLSNVTDVALSSDSKTLTVTKRDGTSFNFQGGGSDLSNYVTTNTEQTITAAKRFNARVTVDDPNTDTAITVIGSTSGAYINYLNTSGAVLGYLGCNSSKRASFYNGTYYTLAYTTEIPKLGTTNWNVAQDSSGNLVFTYA